MAHQATPSARTADHASSFDNDTIRTCVFGRIEVMAVRRHSPYPVIHGPVPEWLELVGRGRHASGSYPTILLSALVCRTMPPPWIMIRYGQILDVIWRHHRAIGRGNRTNVASCALARPNIVLGRKLGGWNCRPHERVGARSRPDSSCPSRLAKSRPELESHGRSFPLSRSLVVEEPR